LTEPLVDVVNAEQVVTNSAEVLTVDIMTVTKEQLTFKSDFSIKAKRNDFCHAIVAYFDMFFSKGHKLIDFSTGPHAKYTHWKQTVFYLKDDLAINSGDEIKGTISCKPNASNQRDLDISLTVEHNSTTQTQDYLMR
jgi:protein arginine N-methyltransferase 1